MKKKKLFSFLVAAALSCSLFSAVPIASRAADLTGVSMYRLYNPNSGEHFYTKDAIEQRSLIKAGWSDEGIGWIAPEKSNTPVYRLYNENAGDHHYTVDAKEKEGLVRAGWKDEGIGWYSDDDKTVPLYREYNPNAVTGTHNYTTSKAEHNKLVEIGWTDENIGWYGINKKVDPIFPNAQIGDIVTFGTYEQDNDLTNGAEPIEWQYVGDKDGHKLLLAKYALDCKQYVSAKVEKDVTWETWSLRKWLNDDFYNTAFSSADKEKIVTAYNENPDSYEWWEGEDDWKLTDWRFEPWGAYGGYDTDDNVFLLSWTEAEKYFNGKLHDSPDPYVYNPANYNPALICKPTAYAISRGVDTFVNGKPLKWSSVTYPSDVEGCCEWWLRSPGATQDSCAIVCAWGSLSSRSTFYGYIGVRPAILID